MNSITVPTCSYRAFELANETLKMLQCPASFLNDGEIDSDFLVNLGAMLFGSETVEYKKPTSENEMLHNLQNLIEKMSVIVGTSLKHIHPKAIFRGDTAVVKDLIEIIHAFVAYCVRANLLDFSNSGHNSEYGDNGEAHASRLEMSTSPEVPRSTGRSYIQRHSLNHTSTGNKNGIITCRDEQTYLVNSTGYNHATQCGKNINNWHMSRLHGSYSPPTTPQAVDEILHLEKDQSPTHPMLSPVFSPSAVDSTTTLVVKPALSKGSRHEPDSISSSSQHKQVTSSSSGRGHSPSTSSAAFTADHPPSLSSAPKTADLASSKHTPNGMTDKADDRAAALTEDNVASELDDSHVFAHLNDTVDLLQASISDSSAFTMPLGDSLINTDRADEPAARFHTRRRRTHHLRDWERPYGSAVSTASIMLARTEGFSRSLKRRLSHLRAMFSRAQAEADAVSRLVATLTLGKPCHCGGKEDLPAGVKESVLMLGQEPAPGDQRKETGDRSVDSQSFVTLPCLRDMLQQVLSGVNTLLARHDEELSQKSEVGQAGDSLVPWEMEYLEVMRMRDRLMLDALSILEGILRSQPLMSKKTTTTVLSPTRRPSVNVV